MNEEVKIIRCSCGYECADSNTRCPKCGKELKSMAKKCPKCGSNQIETAKFCSNCGADIANVVVEKTDTKVLKDMYCEKCMIKVKGSDGDTCSKCGAKLVDAPAVVNAKEGTAVTLQEFGSLCLQSEDQYLTELISDELNKDAMYKGKTLSSIETRKTIMSAIYGVVVFLIVLLYVAYHVAFAFCTFLVIVLTIIYYLLVKKYNLKTYILKEVKSRPDEKISNITASILSSASNKKSLFLTIRIVIVGLFLLLPLILFSEPHLIYEKSSDGYVIRYYTLGIFKQDSEITIPEKHNGEKVTGIRGETFRSVTSLEKVVLPDTITEIRGGAFKYCRNLKEIKLPSKLKSIGGQAFTGCENLEEIEIPETVTEIGGEAFKDCKNLSSIKLPENITEIHGNTFENCTSLESITIPDNVTRIGGHAFYGCYHLSSVLVSENSKLVEIGSSAFRRCTNLYSIKLPAGVSINQRAFKESPTYVEYYGANISSDVDGYTRKDEFTFHENDEYNFVVNGVTNRLKLGYIFAYSQTVTFNLYVGDSPVYKYIRIDSNEGYEKINDNLLIKIERFNAQDNSVTVTVYYN